jgi:hypothetical protein
MKDNKQNKTSLKEKKQYVKPVLKPLGDIRDVTMGGSVGVGDSGNAGIEKPF